MKRAEQRLIDAEIKLHDAWLDYVRHCLADRCVRLDVSPQSLRELPRFVQIAPGMVIRAGEERP